MEEYLAKLTAKELHELGELLAIRKANEEANQTVQSKKSKTGKRPKTGKKVSLKQPALDDLTDSDEEAFKPIAYIPLPDKIKKNINKFNVTELTQDPKNITRNHLYQRIKLSGITHYDGKPLLKFPKGDTDYWRDIW